MKKRYLAIGVVSSIFAGAAVYNKIKEKKDNNVLMYPVCRVTIHSDMFTYDIDSLIKESELIVSGYVEKVEEPRWNNSDNHQPESINSDDVIYKDYKIKVQNVIKGMDYSISEVKLRSYEGSLNGFTIEDNSQIILDRDDRIIAFLSRDKSNFNKRKQTDYYIPVGDKAGVFMVTESKISNSNLNYGVEEFNTLMKFI